MNQQDNGASQPTGGQPQGPARIMAGQMNVYYSNCALVAASHREISVFFGRLVPYGEGPGGSQLAELYEKHIYMTVEQAQDLIRVLSQTVQAFRGNREAARAAAEQAASRPLGPVT